jgi:hypothetical protein
MMIKSIVKLASISLIVIALASELIGCGPQKSYQASNAINCSSSASQPIDYKQEGINLEQIANEYSRLIYSEDAVPSSIKSDIKNDFARISKLSGSEKTCTLLNIIQKSADYYVAQTMYAMLTEGKVLKTNAIEKLMDYSISAMQVEFDRQKKAPSIGTDPFFESTRMINTFLDYASTFNVFDFSNEQPVGIMLGKISKKGAYESNDLMFNNWDDSTGSRTQLSKNLPFSPYYVFEGYLNDGHQLSTIYPHIFFVSVGNMYTTSKYAAFPNQEAKPGIKPNFAEIYFSP